MANIKRVINQKKCKCTTCKNPIQVGDVVIKQHYNAKLKKALKKDMPNERHHELCYVGGKK